MVGQNGCAATHLGFDSPTGYENMTNHVVFQQDTEDGKMDALGWNFSGYAMEINHVDTSVAYDCEADRAEREGFQSVAKRQRANALHLRNAVRHMEKLCPEGYRVQVKIVVSHVPNVNPVLKDGLA